MKVTSKQSVSRWRNKTKAWFVEYTGGKCQCCDYNKHIGNLDFHHVDPATKKYRVSDMLRNPKSLFVIKEEVDKCVLVCNRCHGEIHAELLECPEIDFKERELNWNRLWNSRPIPKSQKQRYCLNCAEPIKLGKDIRAKYCSVECRAASQEIIEWPENLDELVEKSSKLAVAKELGVSDKAVAKRLKNHFGRVAQC